MPKPERTPAAPFDLNRPLKDIIAEVQGEPLPEPVDEYVGKSPAQLEERDAILEAQAPPPPDPVALERKVKLLEEMLAENMELVKQIAKDRGGYSSAARETVLLHAVMQRRETYERIRRNGGFCTILIHTHEDLGQNWPVSLGVNGNKLIIPRGEPTVIPVEHLEVLDNAIHDVWVKELDGDDNPRLVHYQRLSYPYSLLDYQPAGVDVPRVAA